jgi:glycosyltransferase involved in cell wall biosynthesis
MGPRTDLELAVVGDGPLRSALESRRVPNVRFLGRLASADVQRLMLTSRGLVFPSVWYEGQPMVLLEALAAGLPVAVSDIGGIPETVGGADAAVLVRPGDTGAWAAAFHHLNDDDRVDALGTSGRQVFEARYAPEVGLENLHAVYRTAIARRGGKR